MTFQTNSAFKPRMIGAVPVLEIDNPFAKAMISCRRAGFKLSAKRSGEGPLAEPASGYG